MSPARSRAPPQDGVRDFLGQRLQSCVDGGDAFSRLTLAPLDVLPALVERRQAVIGALTAQDELRGNEAIALGLDGVQAGLRGGGLSTQSSRILARRTRGDVISLGRVATASGDRVRALGRRARVIDEREQCTGIAARRGSAALEQRRSLSLGLGELLMEGLDVRGSGALRSERLGGTPSSHLVLRC